MLANYLAHGEEVEAADSGLLDALTHQPAWISLLIIAFVLFGLYVLLEKLNVKPLNRVVALVPLVILIAILYLEHNSAVTTVVLSVGFVATFVLAFMLLAGKQDKKPKEDSNDAGKE